MSKEIRQNDAANSTDFEEVGIYFSQRSINILFSRLLEGRGVRTRVLDAIYEHAEGTRIITEPMFFPYLDDLSKAKCLLVGNSEEPKQTDAVCLSRPLTEEKIEAALRSFLG